MSKDIKEYIHYYWNTSMMAAPNHSPTAKPIECRLLGIPRSGTEYEMISADGVEFFSFGYTVKPILRKLESMTGEEIIEMFLIRGLAKPDKITRTGIEGTFMQVEGYYDRAYVSDWQDIRTIYPDQFHYLISRGFDLWNLIDEGLAIDKETLKG